MPSPIEWGIGVVVILILGLSIATASIGKECYNENKLWGEDAKRKANSNYLTVGIWAPIVAILAVGGGLGFAQYMESQGKGVGITAKYPATPDFGDDAGVVYTPNPLLASDAGTPPPLPPESTEEVE